MANSKLNIPYFWAVTPFLILFTYFQSKPFTITSDLFVVDDAE
jgi:hypothetical protein